MDKGNLLERIGTSSKVRAGGESNGGGVHSARLESEVGSMGGGRGQDWSQQGRDLAKKEKEGPLKQSPSRKRGLGRGGAGGEGRGGEGSNENGVWGSGEVDASIVSATAHDSSVRLLCA